MVQTVKCNADDSNARLHVIDAVMIFRENIRPEWEDDSKGALGFLVLTSCVKATCSRQQLQQAQYWKDKTNAAGGHFQFQLKPQIGGGQAAETVGNRNLVGLRGPYDLVCKSLQQDLNFNFGRWTSIGQQLIAERLLPCGTSALLNLRGTTLCWA